MEVTSPIIYFFESINDFITDSHSNICILHYKISDRDKLFLVVADFNPNAKGFYESMGYHQVGEIPGLYREGITEYIMMKEK